MVRIMVIAAALLVSGSVAAQPPDIVFQFEAVTSEIIEDFWVPKPRTLPDNVPYQLGLLTLTGAASRQHSAQYSTETNPITDDKRVVSFAFTGSGCNPATNKGSCSPMMWWPPRVPVAMWQQETLPARVTIDVQLQRGGLGGTIDITNPVSHSCELHMTGISGHWSGTWGCGRVEHAFTAQSTP